MNCPACNHQISKKAVSCVTCGEPVSWVHPKIKLFEEYKDKGFTDKAFSFESDRLSIKGQTEPKLALFEFVIACCVFLSFILFAAKLPFFVAVIGGLILGFGISKYRDKYGSRYSFEVDLSKDTWASSDDKFWHNVKKFFLTDNFDTNGMLTESQQIELRINKYKKEMDSLGVKERDAFPFVYELIYSFSSFRPIPPMSTTVGDNIKNWFFISLPISCVAGGLMILLDGKSPPLWLFIFTAIAFSAALSIISSVLIAKKCKANEFPKF